MKKSQEKLIKDEIDRMLRSGSSDFQFLMRQVKNRRRTVELNIPQMVASMAPQKQLILEWGRGTGKTTIIGHRLTRILEQMPRSTGLLIGPTYQFILTRIIPSLIQGLEMFGIYEGLHYFIAKEPPRSWRSMWGTAYQPPKRYDKYITFWNGVGIHLISHDVQGDGRGLNTDWVIGDEAALLSADKLQANTDPTLRGTKTRLFRDAPFFGSKMYCSSTPLSPEGQWFVQMEEKARAHPKDICFISATCEYNRLNLREGYLEEAERNAYAKWVFDAEYRNIRPNFSSDGFYGMLDAGKHCYVNFDYSHYQAVGQDLDCRGDADRVDSMPLILGVDWGAAINCLTVSQYVKSQNEHRVLKSMYVLGADHKIQDDLFEDFATYYLHHTCKEVEVWYDNTGNVDTGHTRRTRAQKAADLLRAKGWTVNLLTRGDTNPLHNIKHLLWEAILTEKNRALPRFRINKSNCRELYLSMRNAKAVPGRNGEVRKDKSIERSKKIPRQEATDLSDAMDSVIFGRYYNLMQYGGAGLPGPKVTTAS